jgi:hypothetical protein
LLQKLCRQGAASSGGKTGNGLTLALPMNRSADLLIGQFLKLNRKVPIWRSALLSFRRFRGSMRGIPFRGNLTPALSPGERIPRNIVSRLEPLNRSSRRESALTFPNSRWSGLTSAATSFMGRVQLSRVLKIRLLLRVFPLLLIWHEGGR